CLFYLLFVLFFFNTAATTEIYTLSLHDALPISTIDWPSHQPEPGWCERSARLRAYCRRILARLPQPSILHHWRLPFLLVSRKSQPQFPTPGHSFTFFTSSEVKSSTAECTTGHSI